MMKKYFNYALVIAIAFLGTCAFTACSSEDSVTTDNNPTYDPATNTVTAQFVLNVSAADIATRQTSTIVQKNQKDQCHCIKLDLHLSRHSFSINSAGDNIDQRHQDRKQIHGKPGYTNQSVWCAKVSQRAE